MLDQIDDDDDVRIVQPFSLNSSSWSQNRGLRDVWGGLQGALRERLGGRKASTVVRHNTGMSVQHTIVHAAGVRYTVYLVQYETPNKKQEGKMVQAGFLIWITWA